MAASGKRGRKRLAPRLLLIGGGERRNEKSVVLQRFVELAGGSDARVLVCGAATEYAQEALAEYRALFSGLGAAEVMGVSYDNRHDGESEELLEQLERVDAVFFTGGDQLQITSLVAGTPFGEALRRHLGEGDLLLAGTSAGAAAMSSTMIAGGPGGGTVRRGDVKLAPGLGYWRDAVVDTHFNQRGRVHRLLAVFAQNPQLMGLGIDEDTAVEVHLGHELRVHGSGAVMLFHGTPEHTNAANALEDEVLALAGARIDVLPDGYGMNLKTMELLVAERDR